VVSPFCFVRGYPKRQVAKAQALALTHLKTKRTILRMIFSLAVHTLL
jgi:hypothetical protein